MHNLDSLSLFLWNVSFYEIVSSEMLLCFVRNTLLKIWSDFESQLMRFRNQFVNIIVFFLSN